MRLKMFACMKMAAEILMQGDPKSDQKGSSDRMLVIAWQLHLGSEVVIR